MQFQHWLEMNKNDDQNVIRLESSVKDKILAKANMVHVFQELHTKGPAWWKYRNQQNYNPKHDIFVSNKMIQISDKSNREYNNNHSSSMHSIRISDNNNRNNKSSKKYTNTTNSKRYSNRSPLQSLDYNCIHPNNKSPIVVSNEIHRTTITAGVSNINTSKHFDNMRPDSMYDYDDDDRSTRNTLHSIKRSTKLLLNQIFKDNFYATVKL